jgi:hypothetical protein
MINHGNCEAKFQKGSRQAMKPGSWSLLKTIDRFVKIAYKIWLSCIHKTLRLLYVNLLQHGTMEESIRDIYLLNRLVIVYNQG